MDKHALNEPEVRPPRWADRFLAWYCAPELLDEIQGDLHEAFHRRRKKYNLRKAQRMFVAEVLLFCKPSSFPKFDYPYHLINMPGMISNYLKIAGRNTLKNKVFSLINIFGLAIGLAACFLILQYVHFELSYDQFHEQADRIYRVIREGGRTKGATNHPGVGPALKADFPEVQEYARAVHQSIFIGNLTTWSYIDEAGEVTVFNEERVYNVDPSFLTMFSFPFVYGNPEHAFPNTSAVVISESISKKFFGSDNPMGKTLLLNGQRPFTVTGVFQDVPENSHIQFDILVSYFFTEGWGGEWNHNWDWRWPEYFTYVLLNPQAKAEALEAKFSDFAQQYLGEQMKELNEEERFFLQPVADIHLKSPQLTKEQEVHGNAQTVYFLLLIAMMILLIAWINYINLSTSKSIERAQEVGLRKVAGASRTQLITQFLFESAIVNFLAMGVSLILVMVTLPFFNQLTGKNIGTTMLDLVLVKEYWFWLILAGVFVFGSCCAGLYPAFVLSSFRITTVLKGKFIRSRSGTTMRKILVGFQFVISIALIAGTIMVFRQVTYMRNQDMGYVKDQLLIVKSPRIVDSTLQQRLETFKTELSRNPDIHRMAPSSDIPGKLISQLNFIRNRGEGTDENSIAYHVYIDRDFIETYGLTMVAGRNFREEERLPPPDQRTDPVPVMVNEKAAASLGYHEGEEALHQLIIFGLGPGEWVGEIIGVVSNHHQQSLKADYDPLLFFPIPGLLGQYFTINLSMQRPSETISFIEQQYEAAFPDNPFEYFFLDDYFNRQYAADQQFGSVFGLFSGLALIVACLGLFGLSTFMISQRIKEIAIRKVLGANLTSMVLLFSGDFLKLILIANLCALPLVYLAVNQWLNNFAFHVNIGWLMFVLPAVTLLLISLTTVSIQTIKTGLKNPIKSLRAE